MTDQQETGKAYASGAEGIRETAASPMNWSDKCFLCGRGIGETDPRGFYTGKKNNAMMLAHRGCLDKLAAVGGDPKDFPRTESDTRKVARAADADKPLEAGTPVHAVVYTDDAAVEVPLAVSSPFAGTHIRFDSFEHMQSFIQARGPIPDGVKISIGDHVIREA